MEHMGTRVWVGWLLAVAVAVVAGCAAGNNQKEAGDTTAHLYKPSSIDEVARLAPAEQIRYFTDNVYLAAVDRNDSRAAAATAALRHLQDSLSKEEFVRFWTGVDSEFFGRVNAVLEYPDYTHRQVTLDQRRTRTAYNLGARHLDGIEGAGQARQLAMRDLIEFAAKGDSAACFAFHKAYKDYPKPRGGAQQLSWPQVDGKPFRKSMWAGSAEAVVGGQVVQIPIPAEVVLGCRQLVQPPATMAAGVTQEVEQYFAAIQLNKDFDAAAFAERRDAWRRDLIQQALKESERLRLDRIRIVNVVDVYQIFPPALDYEYELATGDGSLPELVAAGVLSEQDAFVVEQRIAERKILITGVGITPKDTPMAFLQMVVNRTPTRKK